MSISKIEPSWLVGNFDGNSIIDGGRKSNTVALWAPKKKRVMRTDEGIVEWIVVNVAPQLEGPVEGFGGLSMGSQ